MKVKINTYIIRFLLIALMCVILYVSGCGDNSWVNSRLDEAERLMEGRPDSALAILDSIHPATIEKKEQLARYALLKSMALDKNCIDMTDFEVMQPAIDHYVENGTPDEKLRTYYYRARIYQNRNDRDSALYSLMRGFELAEKCKDSLAVARILAVQGILLKSFYDIDGYTECYIKAAGIMHNKHNQLYEFDFLLNSLNGLILLDKKSRADSIVKLLERFDSLDETQSRRFRSYILAYHLQFGSHEDLRLWLKTNKDSLTHDANLILNLARAYHRLGDNNRAIEYLASLDDARAPYDTLKYLSIKYPLLEDLGKYQHALDAYKDFSKRLETINSEKFEQKSRSMEDKHQMEIQAEKNDQMHAKTMWELIGGIGVLATMLIIFLLIMRSQRIRRHLAEAKAHTAELENDNLKAERGRLALENQNFQLERDKNALEAEALSRRVEELEGESEDLKELLQSQQEMPEEVRQAIRTRIEMLNSYLASQISDHKEFEKAYDDWVAELTADSERFMDSNRLAFQASHPEFIKYFEDHGLTTSEINYVCLYAIGLRGKDVGNYMRKRSHVNISSAIRAKLGIDRHETNIGIYVRKKLKSM